jgi:hypothetical protein
MECDPQIFAVLEERLVHRSTPPVPFATRSRIIDAVQTEVSKPSRHQSSIPLPWVGIIVVMAVGMLQLMGSAASFEIDDRSAGRSVAVTPDMLKQLTSDPAERQIMADSLAFCDPAPIRLVPSIDSRLANFRGSGADALFQETP